MFYALVVQNCDCKLLYFLAHDSGQLSPCTIKRKTSAGKENSFKWAYIAQIAFTCPFFRRQKQSLSLCYRMKFRWWRQKLKWWYWYWWQRWWRWFLIRWWKWPTNKQIPSLLTKNVSILDTFAWWKKAIKSGKGLKPPPRNAHLKQFSADVFPIEVIFSTF